MAGQAQAVATPGPRGTWVWVPEDSSTETTTVEAVSTSAAGQGTVETPTPIVFAGGVVPCYEVGQPPTGRWYLLIGFAIPFACSLLLLYFWARRKLRKRFGKNGGYQNLDEANGKYWGNMSSRQHGATPVMDKFNTLITNKTSSSRVWIWICEATDPLKPAGQYMLMAGILAAAVSFAVYLAAVSENIPSLELCRTMPNAPQILDFFANVFLLIYFIIRLIGTEKNLKVLLDPYSIVDYFCIPAALVNPFLDRYLTGVAFLRSFNLLWIVQVLADRGIIRDPPKIKLVKLVLILLLTLIISTGIIHSVENKGDPFPFMYRDAPYNGQPVNFWRVLLYLYGRLTLIDMSGITIRTMLGKLFVYVFQLVALGYIVRTAAQIFHLIRITPQYDKGYEVPERSLHIVVAGHITAESAKAFLKEFFHKDRNLHEFCTILVLGERKPDEDMGRLMKRYFNMADYRRGSIMTVSDLDRVRLSEAAAAVIIADKTTARINEEDARNLLRVISIKNYKPDARVVVQLLQYQSKAYLTNIPSWKPETGDIVFCIAELRLGILAQSCYAPGFSTLLSNFFTSHMRFREDKQYSEAWLEDYARGCAFELYSRPLSSSFVGLSFTQACEFSYLRLGLVLIAVKTDPNNSSTMPRINPADCRIEKGTIGFIIAESSKAAERAMHFCIRCHRDVTHPELINQCECAGTKEDAIHEILDAAGIHAASAQATIRANLRAPGNRELEGKVWSFIRHHSTIPTGDKGAETDDPRKKTELRARQQEEGANDEQSNTKRKEEEEECLYDYTGMFHWIPARSIESIMLTREEAAIKTFNGHIVICIIMTPKSKISGLHSFILPLRSSVIDRQQLREIVILTEHKFQLKEWRSLMNLPGITIVQGTPLERADLRAVNLNTCKMCVILAIPSPGKPDSDVDHALIDKSVILSTLNVRAMKFSEDEDAQMLHLNEDSDVESLVSETDSLYEQKIAMKMRARQTGYEVPLITDLMRDSNVQFLDQEDEDKSETDFYMAQPYACGRAFSASVLDMLLITSIFNPIIVNVFRIMIFAGASDQLEKILAEGAGLIGGHGISNPANLKDQIIVSQFPIYKGPLSSHVQSTYGGMFIDALLNYGKLCLGVYRMVYASEDSSMASKRFVVSNPPADFILTTTDYIFCLERPKTQGRSTGTTLDGGEATVRSRRNVSQSSSSLSSGSSRSDRINKR